VTQTVKYHQHNRTLLQQLQAIGHAGGIFEAVRNYGGAIGKAALHGISRAGISKLQTGSGKGGFLSGFASSLLGGVVNGVQNASTAIKVTIAAIAGGTASAIGGGKFANGAMAGAFIMLFNDLLYYNGQTINHYSDNGKLLGSYPATSGRPGTTIGDQTLSNTGPIPEGNYYLDKSEISEVSYLSYLKRMLSPIASGKLALADWGHVRAPLHPFSSTNTYGRSGFFLHGGMFSGSAGCIDIGSMDIVLFNKLRNTTTPITIQVRY
jgi:hypothetical protein